MSETFMVDVTSKIVDREAVIHRISIAIVGAQGTIETTLYREGSDAVIEVEDGLLTLGGHPLLFLENLLETARIAEELKASDNDRFRGAARIGSYWQSADRTRKRVYFPDLPSFLGISVERFKSGKIKKVKELGKVLDKDKGERLAQALDGRAHIDLDFPQCIRLERIDAYLENRLRAAIEERIAEAA